VPELFELCTDLTVIVDFAVKDEPFGAVVIVNRLLAGFQIDDCQTAHRQSDAIIEIETIFIGPAVADRLAHPLKQIAVNGSSVSANYSGNATHRF
jgi:hypothetical protein